jgi:hypothetical protein
MKVNDELLLLKIYIIELYTFFKMSFRYDLYEVLVPFSFEYII